MPRLLTYAQAASIAGVSAKTIQRAVKAQKLPTLDRAGRPLVPEDALRHLYALPEAAESHSEGCRTIAVVNQKGGVGKTTTAANLAAALAEDSRVLAIDCDGQGNLTVSYGYVPDKCDPTTLDVLTERASIQQAKLTPYQALENLQFIPANIQLTEAEYFLVNAIGGQERLRFALEPETSRYDFIVIDCPPTLGVLALNGLYAATDVIIPVDMGLFSLLGVNGLLNTISTVQNYNPRLRRIRAFSNKVDERKRVDKEIQAALKSSFGDDMFKTVIKDRAAITQAQSRRQPVILFDDEAATDYFSLAQEVRNA